MAEIVLFHHAQGRTTGVLDFGTVLEEAGHRVHCPDLYDGVTFPNLEQGVRHAQEVGFDTIEERGRLYVEDLLPTVVYAGFSLGVIPAQKLAMTRPGASGALFFSAALPVAHFGAGWPTDLPLQVHMMQDDPWSIEDMPAALELTASCERATLYLYSGDRHLFLDISLDEYDAEAATLLQQRVLEFLAAID